MARFPGGEMTGNPTANDMVQHFEESVVNSGLPICNLAQISMDGPSVNWKFFTDMKKKHTSQLKLILSLFPVNFCCLLLNYY